VRLLAHSAVIRVQACTSKFREPGRYGITPVLYMVRSGPPGPVFGGWCGGAYCTSFVPFQPAGGRWELRTPVEHRGLMPHALLGTRGMAN
jgi:hypothetical protein